MAKPNQVIGEGKSYVLGKHETYRGEYVSRMDAKGHVAVLAVTNQREIVLTEQYRVPLGKRVLELPGGLAGDEPLNPDEPLLAAAKRRLYDDSGYEAGKWWSLFDGPLSPLVTDELLTLFLATEIRKISEAERFGADRNYIKTYLVRLGDLEDLTESARDRGCLVDFRIHAALNLARSHPMFPV